jgi:crotonobetainyl-CoA:carnitine CoA-transferase CaiB-like acyl-CoA transferase
MGKSELAQDDRFETVSSRLEEGHNAELHEILSKWVSAKTTVEIEYLADIHRFPAQRVCNAEDHYTDEHLRHRGAVWEYEDPLYGTLVEYGPGPKLSESPGRHKWFTKPVGFHNDHVCRNVLNLREEEIQQLKDEEVVGAWMDRIGAKPPDDWNGEDGVFF